MQTPENAPMLSWDQVREMLASGLCEIASHGHRHRALPVLSKRLAAEELELSAEIIESQVGVRPLAYFYPLGALDTASMKSVQRAGYRAAFSAKGGPIAIGSSPLMRIPRTSIFHDDDLGHLAYYFSQRFFERLPETARSPAEALVSASRESDVQLLNRERRRRRLALGWRSSRRRRCGWRLRSRLLGDRALRAGHRFFRHRARRDRFFDDRFFDDRFFDDRFLGNDGRRLGLRRRWNFDGGVGGRHAGRCFGRGRRRCVRLDRGQGLDRRLGGFRGTRRHSRRFAVAPRTPHPDDRDRETEANHTRHQPHVAGTPLFLLGRAHDGLRLLPLHLFDQGRDLARLGGDLGRATFVATLVAFGEEIVVDVERVGGPDRHDWTFGQSALLFFVRAGAGRGSLAGNGGGTCVRPCETRGDSYRAPPATGLSARPPTRRRRGLRLPLRVAGNGITLPSPYLAPGLSRVVDGSCDSAPALALATAARISGVSGSVADARNRTRPRSSSLESSSVVAAPVEAYFSDLLRLGRRLFGLGLGFVRPRSVGQRGRSEPHHGPVYRRRPAGVDVVARTRSRLRDLAELAQRGHDQPRATVVVPGRGRPIALETGERLHPALLGASCSSTGAAGRSTRAVLFLRRLRCGTRRGVSSFGSLAARSGTMSSSLARSSLGSLPASLGTTSSCDAGAASDTTSRPSK